MTPARLFAFASLATALAMLALCSSQHRVRLIFGSFHPVDSVATLPISAPMQFMTAYPDAPYEPSSAPGFDSIVHQLARFEALHPLHDGDALPALDQPDTCERLLDEGKAIHCYNADIGVCAILAQENVPARLWDITGPTELGGNGHNLLEVFDCDSHAWKALDPYYHCYFTLWSDSLNPIDVPTLRLALLAHPASVRLARYATVVDARPDSIVLAELRSLVPCAMLHANNDFRARYANRYGWMMPIASTIDRLPLRASRGVRTLMLGAGDSHYIIEDTNSPHYPFRAMKILFWSLLLLFGIFYGLALFFMRHERKQKAH